MSTVDTSTQAIEPPKPNGLRQLVQRFARLLTPDEKAAAVKRYREAIRSAPDGATVEDLDPALLDAAEILHQQAVEDLACQFRRREAHKIGIVDYEQYRAEAAGLRAKFDAGSRVLGQHPATTNWQEALAYLEAETGQPITTLAGLAGAINWLAAGPLPTYSREAARCDRLAEDVRERAEQLLCQTADEELAQRQRGVLDAIRVAANRIEGRQPIIDAERIIARRVDRCERAKRGELLEPDPWEPRSTVGDYATPRDRYVAERRKLEAAQQMLSQRPQAEKQNAADMNQIASLEAEIASIKAAMLDPRNQAWAD
jgi:hypothetical protein